MSAPPPDFARADLRRPKRLKLSPLARPDLRKPKRRIRNRPEQALQIAVVEFLDCALPIGAIAHHSPNGGGRSKAEAGLFKAMGVRRGWPDLTILCMRRAIFIELKAPGEKSSEVQSKMQDALERAGFHSYVCDTIDEVERVLLAEGIPLRARLST